MKGIKPKKVEPTKVGGPKELDYWEPAKQLLSDQKFLDSLMKYDKDNIPDSVIQNIQPCILPCSGFYILFFEPLRYNE